MGTHALVLAAPETSKNLMLMHDRSHAAGTAGQTLSIVSSCNARTCTGACTQRHLRIRCSCMTAVMLPARLARHSQQCHDGMCTHASVQVAPESSENQLLIPDRSHDASAAGHTLSQVCHDVMRTHASVPVAPETPESQMHMPDRDHAASASWPDTLNSVMMQCTRMHGCQEHQIHLRIKSLFMTAVIASAAGRHS